MKYVICSVRDRAADVFGVPFSSVSIGSAIRSFTDEVNRSDVANSLFKHPEDFDLYALGVFDDNNGEYDCGVPRQVAIGKDCAVRSNGGG